jgi:hypothetical protein
MVCPRSLAEVNRISRIREQPSPLADANGIFDIVGIELIWDFGKPLRVRNAKLLVGIP